ncbi:glycosyltransferase [Pedobacter aquatilis]|uniref:glycosyltransferase n=1 Tax=Pedobacter aquatilis TaxID=351343 RepID=UPI0025B55F90|nr:glycosyltransferase [Pedobacter aquatilis]MDN3585403.1 glycosyltransferase [Pedobacter aquatilis]
MDKKFDNDIIIIGQQPWDTEIGSNCKDIALELSKNNRVLYINSPLDRITLLRGKNDDKIKKRINVIKNKEQGLIKIKDNLWNLFPDCIVESINWINYHNLFNFINKLNNKKLATSVKSALTELGFRNTILFNDNEMFKGFYLDVLLKPDLSIYYSRDYMLGVDYWRKHGEYLEPKLISKSDICFANSTYLADYCKQYNQDSFYVGQGCDIDDFANRNIDAIPSDLPLDKPIVGYVGALNTIRLDIEIIEHIAVACPDINFVLVGGEDEVFKNSLLHSIDNIIFLGQKPVEDLPKYINNFDVCINPQLINPVTIGNYPRKIDEYLSLGKPIIASSTKTMEVFKNHVYLANSKEDYVQLIRQAIKENNQELIDERIRFALTHTWENSVDLMRVQISKKLKEKFKH